MIKPESPAVPGVASPPRDVAPTVPVNVETTSENGGDERGTRRKRRATLREPTVVLLLYVLLTVVLTYPIAFTLGDHVPGAPRGDQFFSLWQIWFPAHAIFNLGISPLVDPSIYYPYGFSMVRNGDMAPATIFPLMPFTLLFGEVIAHNLFVLATFVLTAFGTYLFARQLGAGRPGAFLAGVVVAFGTYRYAHTGHLTIIATHWIPFFFLYLERTIVRPTLRNGVLAGFFYALVALSTWYYAGFAAVAAVLYVAARRRWWADRRGLGPLVRAGATAVAVASVLMGPFVVLYAREVTGGTMAARRAEESQAFSASLADFFIPNLFHPLWGSWVAATWRSDSNGLWMSEWSVGLSVVALALALAAVVGRRRGGAVAALAVMALGTAVLALGPSLHLTHPPTLPGAPNMIPLSSIPLPVRLLESIPPFSILRAYSRFAIFVYLGVGVLAGLGLTLLLDRLAARGAPGRRAALSAGLAGLAIGLVTFETLAVPWPVAPVEPRPIETWLAEQPEAYTITEYPIPGHGFSGAAMYSTRVTGKRIILGYSSYPPIMHYWSTLSFFPSIESLDLLRSLDVRYVLVDETPYRAGVHAGWGERQTWTSMHAAIVGSRRLREVVVRGGVHAYEVLDAPAAGDSASESLAVDLLQNGGFEDPSPAGPFGWTRSGGSLDYDRSASEARTGDAGVRLAAPGAISSTLSAIDPDSCYRLRLFARADEPNTALRIQINALDERERLLVPPSAWGRVVPLAAGRDWQPIEAVYRSPAGASLLSMTAVAQAGRAWLDDVSLWAESAPCDRSRLIASGGAGLLPNSGFEHQSPSGPFGWISDGGSPGFDSTGTRARSGTTAVSLAAGDVVSSMEVEIDPSACYRLGLFARADGPDSTLRLQINALDDAGNGFDPSSAWGRGVSIPSGADWQEIEGVYRSPSAARFVTVTAVGESGRTWIDDFALHTVEAPCDRPRLVAQPNPVPAGSTATALTWDTGDDSSGQLWLITDAREVLISDVGAGWASIPWIEPGSTYEFRLYAGTDRARVLASVVVEQAHR